MKINDNKRVKETEKNPGCGYKQSNSHKETLNSLV